MNSVSVPSPLASTPRSSSPASLAANSTNPSSVIFPPTSTLAVKTANSTLSSSMAPFFNLPSPFEREKLSIAMASSSAIYCPPSIPPPPQTQVSFRAEDRRLCSPQSRNLLFPKELPKHPTRRNPKMFSETQKENLLYRTLLALVLILLAAALRIAPHPWNFTPVGAMALFSGALLKNRRLAFFFPLLALFLGDVFIGFHKLIPIVYASFLVNVAIGLWLRDRRTVARISLATLLGAIQFFIVTNFAVWQFLSGFPHTASGLAACYIAGIPFFWNTLAGDAVYAALFFGGYVLAERMLPVLRPLSLKTDN